MLVTGNLGETLYNSTLTPYRLPMDKNMQNWLRAQGGDGKTTGRGKAGEYNASSAFKGGAASS